MYLRYSLSVVAPLVVRFVFRAKSFQNQDRLFDRWRFDFHGLKTTFQRSVFFDVLAILVECCRAHAL